MCGVRPLGGERQAVDHRRWHRLARHRSRRLYDRPEKLDPMPTPSITSRTASTEDLVARLLAQAGGDPLTALATLDVRATAHRKRMFAQYWEPVGDQLEFWNQKIYEKKVWVATGTNRSGKTELGAFLCTVWLLGKKFFVNAPNWKWVEPLPVPDGPTAVRGVALKEALLKNPMWEKLTGQSNHPPLFPETEIVKRVDYSFHVEFKNGAIFEGFSASPTVDPKSHGGAALDLVWIDEECGYPYYDESFQRTVDKEGHVLVTATPLDDPSVSIRPWLYDLVHDAIAGETELGRETGVINLSMFNNPHISEKERRLQKAKWTGHPEELPRLWGKFGRRSGLYYPMWKAEPPLWVPATDISDDAYRVVVIDPASNGPTGALWMAFDRRGKMSVYREYKEKGLTASQHVENILIENRGDPINMWLMDPFMGRQTVHSTGDEQQTVLKIWQKSGLPRLRLAEIDYEYCLQESREYIKAAFDPTDPHPGMEVFDHLDKFRDEIERCVIDSYQVGANKGTIKERPRKGNDDLINCWQYACGMRLRARPDRMAAVQAAPGSTSYFDAPSALAGMVHGPRPWDTEPW